MAALTEVKKVKNAILYKDANGQRYMKLERVRLSFPAIARMREQDGENGKKRTMYQGTGMMPKATHEEAYELFQKVISAILKDAEAKVPSGRWALKDGDTDDDDARAEYKGHWIIAANDYKNRPTARDVKGRIMLDTANVKSPEALGQVLDQIEETFYAGCWVDMLVRPYYFNGKARGSDEKFPTRISCGIVAIKFAADDTPFSKGAVDTGGVWDEGGNDDDGLGGDDDL